jgi:HlyD family secretion protein
VLLVMTNPELEQATIDAEWKVKAAEAELNNLKVKLESDRLTQQAAAATVETDSHTEPARSRPGRRTEPPGTDRRHTGQEVRRHGRRPGPTATRSKRSGWRSASKPSRRNSPSSRRPWSSFARMWELKKSQIEAMRVKAGVSGVSRIDPSILNGTVTVDVALKGSFPPARVPI